VARRPNVLLILTDQLRYPPPYESEQLRQYRHEHCVGQERLRQNGVSFNRHYPIAAACAPSRASLLTGQYPSLHGVTQTDGVSKDANNSDEMFWLAPDTVPTLGDWFRAGGYRTYFKGQVARLARASGRRGRRGLPALDRRRRQPPAGEHPEVPGGRPAR
jgi:choline-sulfatase